MKRALLGLIIGTISFFIGFGIAVGYNWLIMKCFNPEYVEILDKVQEIEPSGDSIGSPSKPVTVCELKNDPARYNHSTVILTGYFSRGFEDSTLSDPSCESRQWSAREECSSIFAILDQNFLQLQAELVDTEDKIQASRRFYNGGVRELNTKIKVFPNNLFARRLGFSEREFFEVDNLAAIAEPPRVQF